MCFLPFSLCSLNYEQRRRELSKINNDNHGILSRLQTVKPHYRVHDWVCGVCVCVCVCVHVCVCVCVHARAGMHVCARGMHIHIQITARSTAVGALTYSCIC